MYRDSEICAFLDFVYRPEFCIIENSTFREVDLLPSSGEGRDIPTLLGHLERAHGKMLNV
jgi:hypothetical protein